MATHHKTLQLIASKLGIADEDKVLRKAAEFERLLQTKTTAGSNMSDTSKVVICLDLAAFVLGVELDTKTAIKFSGLKPSTYANSRKVVENLLELNSDKLTVAGVCVKLQCSGVQALAENILEEYRKHAKMELDLNLPQYVCMAVHQACRLNKVKVSKAKLLDTSRLKPAQWGKLEVDWTKLVDENFAAVKRKRGRPAKTTDDNEEMEVDQPHKEETPSEPKTESYEDWKSRILEAAYKELREIEEKEKQMKKHEIERMEEDRRCSRKHSQSRTPRKNSQSRTPRKDSQSRTPTKNSQLVSPRNSANSQRKVLFSPNKELSQISQGLSARKLSVCLKENHLSPRKDDITLMQESPRRSPRKTPQKFSPYKTPTSKNGVRLLFPKNL